MVHMLGDALVSHTRARSSYELQDALDRIEQDTRVTSAFMPSFSLLTAGQGRNASAANTTDTTAFNTTNGDLILNQSATSTNPFDPTRQIVYYADQPNACASTEKYLNRSMAIKIIYFTKDDGKGAGTTDLWRRMVVPTYNTNTGINIDGNSVCNAPWQQDSCPTRVPLATCPAIDEKVLENVATFATDYSNDTTSGLTNSRLADTATISITLSEKAAGKTVASSGKVRAERTNETLDDVPTAVTGLLIKNPTINTDNNPILTTFGWSPSRYASVYSVWYDINNTGRVTKTITDNFIAVPSRPLDNIKVGVTALNDMGSSAEVTYNGLTGYNKPQWTVANLEGNWDSYDAAETNYAKPSYTILPSGMVLLRGLAKDGALDSTIFTLPAGLRPDISLLNNVQVNAAEEGRVDVDPDGAVAYKFGGTSAWVALDSVRFHPNTSSLTWMTPTFSNSWTQYPAYTFKAASDAHGRTIISGRLTPGTNTALLTMATLGSSYREKGGSGIYPGLMYGNDRFMLESSGTADILRTRGVGVTWASLQAIYPNNLSTATVNAVTPSGWTNYGGIYTPARYTKYPDGLVCLQGLIVPTTVTNGTVLFTLPASTINYRPAKRLVFSAADSGTAGYAGQETARIDVLANGNVVIQNNVTSGTWLSLAGICFLQDQ